MLLAFSFSAFAFNTMLAVFVLLYCLFKLIKAVDDDGEISDKASKGLAGWIDRWTK
jgi:hypothetical protein